MTDVTNYTDVPFDPPNVEGLEEVAIFPGSISKRAGIPGSSVWVFRPGFPYQPWILGNDVGCGMTALLMREVNVKETADKFAEYLHANQLLGKGDHFVDLCQYQPLGNGERWPNFFLLVHCGGNLKKPPESMREAMECVKTAGEFRVKLGHDLARLAGSSAEVIGDWPHNTVDDEKGRFVYRSGAIRVQEGGQYLLPVHLGSDILMYGVNPYNMPPRDSFPHATGRSAPEGELECSAKEVEDLRKVAYIPALVREQRLRSQHPACFNGIDGIADKLVNHILSIADLRILAYVGQV